MRTPLLGLATISQYSSRLFAKSGVLEDLNPLNQSVNLQNVYVFRNAKSVSRWNVK